MTPAQRKALHEALDSAINHGAPFTVYCHPRHRADERQLDDILRPHFRADHETSNGVSFLSGANDFHVFESTEADRPSRGDNLDNRWLSDAAI